MSKYHNAFQGFVKAFTAAAKPGVKGGTTTIIGVKPNVPKTEIQKKIKDLKISTQKSKASKAKLDQTVFELKNNKPFTFKKNTKKSESNKERSK